MIKLEDDAMVSDLNSGSLKCPLSVSYGDSREGSPYYRMVAQNALLTSIECEMNHMPGTGDVI